MPGTTAVVRDKAATKARLLDAVGTIDSSGLGELIRSKVTATSNEAEVKLLHVNIKARKLLTMAQLMGVFEMFDDEALAVASFSE